MSKEVLVAECPDDEGLGFSSWWNGVGLFVHFSKTVVVH